jgi:hypothetical protein
MKHIIWSLIVDSILTISSLCLNFCLDRQEAKQNKENLVASNGTDSFLFQSKEEGTSEFLTMSFATEIFSSVAPIIGELRDFYEIFTGDDFLSGEKLRVFDVMLDMISLMFNFYLYFWRRRDSFIQDIRTSLMDFAGDT